MIVYSIIMLVMAAVLYVVSAGSVMYKGNTAAVCSD